MPGQRGRIVRGQRIFRQQVSWLLGQRLIQRIGGNADGDFMGYLPGVVGYEMVIRFKGQNAGVNKLIAAHQGTRCHRADGISRQRITNFITTVGFIDFPGVVVSGLSGGPTNLRIKRDTFTQDDAK